MAGTKIAESGEIASATALIEAFSDHIRQDGFPCVGAKSALQRDGLRVVLAGSLDDSSHDQAIHYDLVEMSARYWNAPTQFHSLAILFPDDPPSSEKRFEHCLWERVNALTAIDMAAGFEPDPRASADPDNAHFSLSFGGRGFSSSACTRMPAVPRAALTPPCSYSTFTNNSNCCGHMARLKRFATR